ncbi:MAG TPA: RidA family protein [Micropepsaceae bacterium]|nr:RidA family protein [Micropepsaceae bacterium]
MTSRREFVTAVSAAAAATAAAPASAQAQAGANVRHSNPSGMSQPTGYSQMVEVNGPHRLIFVAGQTGTDVAGKPAKGFRAQMMQAYANIRTALASAGGTMNNIVRLTTYVTDIEQNADVYREVRAATFTDKNALPASTLVQVVRLADPAYLVEVDAIAILPPRA